MLLEDVRKLKVSELRAELRDRGLDSRGLKAELVVRLLRAVGRTETEQNQPVAVVQAGDASDTDPPALDEGQQPYPTDPRTVSPAGTEPEPPNFKENPTTPPQIHIRPTVDQSTQTETKFCSCLCKWRESEKSPTKSQDVLTGTTDVHDQDVLLTCSPSELTFPAASEPEAPGTCSREPAPPVLTDEESTDAFGSLKRPPCERGRDYYEFKEEIHYLRAKTPEPGPVSEDEMEMDDDMVQLDTYNSDVHFEVGADGRSGQPLLWEKFPLLHSGCRLTHGFSRGKVGFEVKFVQCLLSHTEVPSVDPEAHVLRVGWSVDGSSFQLGNDELSFAFDNSGNVVRAGMTEGFADPFAEGDVIGCYASIGEAGEAELSFSINGRYLGVAFHLKPFSLRGRALFPHVLCKNCSVSLNLDPQDKEWHPGPPGFCPLPRLPPSRQTRAPLPPSHRKDCEVLLMVGLPGSGKSHWARSHMTQNPEKRYNMLSTDAVGRCMSFQLQPPSPAHRETLLQQATQCLTQLLRIAATKRRNFILDQANIYASARRHKMLRFKGYKRRAVVVVPSEEQWKSRLQQRAQNEGAVVPEMSLIKSKVSFTLPEQGDLLEEVLFVELSHGDAQELLRSYKEEAGRLLPAPPPPKRKRQQNRAHGRTQSSSLITPPPQYGRFKPGQNVPASHQSYGCNSDPQQYRDYYQPCTGQWNMYNPNQSYYGNQNYYYGNQPFC